MPISYDGVVLDRKYTRTLRLTLPLTKGGLCVAFTFFIIQVVSYHRIKLPKTKYQASK